METIESIPFLFHFNLGDVAIVGSSPEWCACAMERSPSAQSRALVYGQNEEEDRANASDLLSDIKERAEHLMLLDLGRNDVGRVAQPGTVRVVSNFEIELYSQSRHIASEIQNQIRMRCY